MKIAFSTLGCPAWSWERILDQAASLGYDGIEVRGVNGEMSLAACEPFRPDRITHTLRQLRERELDIVCLGTSCSFHDKSGFVRAVEEGMAAIELAQRLGAPYIRVFGGTVPEFGSKEETVHQVVRGLRTLCGHAAGRDVTVLLETHGDFCLADDVANIVRKVGPGRFGVLWDMGNTAKHHTGGAPSGESPETTVGKLASSIRHVHFKDLLGLYPDQEDVLPGNGEVPIREGLQMLRSVGYSGWLSFEWEKKWNPRLVEPEIAFPQAIAYIRRTLRNVESAP